MNIPRNTKEGWHRENNSLRHGYKSLLIIMVPLMANFDIQVIPMVEPFDGDFIFSNQKRMKIKLGEALFIRGDTPFREVNGEGKYFLTYYFGKKIDIGYFPVEFKTWNCDYCNKVFSVKALMERHVREGRCLPECDKTEEHLQNIKKRKSQNSLLSEYNCSCGAKLRTKTGWIAHVNRCKHIEQLNRLDEGKL